MALLKKHKTNLAKLADYLFDHRPKKSFDMRKFAIDPKIESTARELQPDEKSVHNCGTICCVAGSGPAAGIAAKNNEDWDEYIFRVFGINSDDDEYGYGCWEFLFGADWVEYQNTPKLGAKRIRYFLQHGLSKELYELSADHDFEKVDRILRSYWKSEARRNRSSPFPIYKNNK